MTQTIFIPSRERAELLLARKRHTLVYTKHGSAPVVVVVRACEKQAYSLLVKEFDAHLITTPDEVDSIAKTYDWIVANFPLIKKALFMDDDLIFAKRTSFETSGLKSVEPEEFCSIDSALFESLQNNVALSGIAHRRGAQNLTKPLVYNTKLIAVLCCNLDIIRAEKLKWDWGFKSMFDHNMNLELLTRGYHNVMLGNYTHDDIFTRFKNGGCSSYRGIAEHSKASMALAEKFPNVVTTREKFYEAQRAFGFDVTMHMKSAFGGVKHV